MADSVQGMDTVIQGLEGYISATLEAAAAAADEIAHLLESYAKTHHPWQPKTGATDASTRGFVAEVSEDLILIILTAGMNYDVFLELAHSGKWAWLWPALIENQDRMRAILKRRLGAASLKRI